MNAIQLLLGSQVGVDIVFVLCRTTLVGTFLPPAVRDQWPGPRTK